MDRDGSHIQKVTQYAYAEVGERGEIAEWSPDGSQLLFTAIKGEVSDEAEYVQEVYVVRLDGSRERMISVGARIARDAVWSPDGSLIAYMRKSGTGLGPEVVLAKASGQVLRTLPGYYGYFQPIWSPDGSKIVVTDDRPGPDNLEGPAVRVILDVAGSAPPVVIPAASTVRDDPPDWAASWQRLAP
jgi:Tol biopolymer transport system component